MRPETLLGKICWSLWWTFVILIAAACDIAIMVAIFHHHGYVEPSGVVAGLAACAVTTLLCIACGWGLAEMTGDLWNQIRRVRCRVRG